MARNHQDVDREDRIRRVVDAAEAVLVERGWDSFTIPAIATRVGCRAGSVYWYFTDRESVAVAVFDRALNQALDDLADLPPHEALFSFLGRLDKYRSLAPVVHERSATSAAMARFHGDLHLALDRFLDDLVGAETPDRELVLTAARMCIEGMALHPQSPHSLADVLSVVLPPSTDRRAPPRSGPVERTPAETHGGAPSAGRHIKESP